MFVVSLGLCFRGMLWPLMTLSVGLASRTDA